MTIEEAVYRIQSTYGFSSGKKEGQGTRYHTIIGYVYSIVGNEYASYTSAHGCS
jgi:hypothetical protein